MKKIFYLFGCALLLTGLASCGGSGSYAKTYYVAPDGDDANPGTRQKPFATLEKARDEIRTLKSSGTLPDGGIRVLLSDGTYIRTGTFELTAEDSGTEACPIHYGGRSKERVIFLGGRILSEWTAVTEPGVLSRLDPDVREQILQVDLAATGVADFGTVVSKQDETTRADLFCNGEYMSLARWPDAGEWALIADVPMHGPQRYYYDNITHYGRIVYDGDRPKRWSDQSDLWMQGYWVHDWRDEIKRIARLDTLTREIFPELPHHHYGYRKGQRYFFLNILEELDRPGEYFIDRNAATLYFYPPADISSARVVFPELSQPMISAQDVDHVTIEGITFEASRSGGIVMRGGKGNRIAGCDFVNLGQLAVDIQGGTDNAILSSDFYHLAQGGIRMDGGDRATITPCGHAIENCEIHHNGRIYKTNSPAISMNGVGMRIAHIFMHDTPHTGISFGGNDHLFEYNEFTRIAVETGDVGCLYTMADWTYLGHTVRYNYFHDIHSPGHLGCFTIYPDLPNGGIHLHGNIFYNTDWVFNTNSGRGMLVENNIMLNSHGFSYKIWPFKNMFFPGGSWRMVENMEAVRYDQPPYATRYPMLKQLAEDFKQSDSTVVVMERQLCKDNLIRNNIATGPVFLRFTGEVDLQQVRVENNLICTDAAYSHSPINQYDDFDSYTYNDPVVMKQLEEAGNILMPGEEPGIADPGGEDFSIVPGSPASKMPFEPIPFDKMGLKKDEYRK